MDIVERLRKYADDLGASFPQCDGEMLTEDAANEIERLRVAISSAIEALDDATNDLREDVRYYERMAARLRASVTPNV